MKRTEWKWMVPAGVSALLVLLFFHPVLFSDRTFFFRDFHRFFYPMKAFLAESFQNGRIPFWNPGIFCGSPFMSDMQTGAFYPLSIFFAFLPFPFALNIFILMHFFLAVIFFALFLRASGLHSGSALIGAIAFSYGGYAISSVNVLNNLPAVVWLPAALWAHRIALHGRHPHGNFGVIVFLALLFLGGEPQLFAMGIGILTLTAMVAHPPFRAKQALQHGLVIAALCLAALAVVAVQFGPTWIDYQHSARSGGLPFADAARFSLNSKTLWHFLFPLRFKPNFVASPESLTAFFPGQEIPWVLTVYMGMLTVPFCCGAVLFGTAHRRPWRWTWIAVFSAGALLALGRHTPVFFLFYKILPIFRFPEKFIFLCSTALAVLLAEGVEVLCAALRRHGVRPALVAALLATTMAADLYTHHRHLNPVWHQSAYDRRHRFLAPMVQDSGLFRVHVDGQSLGPAAGAPNTILAHHRRWQAFWMPNLGMLHGVDHVGGRAGLELHHQYWITELLSGSWKQKIAFLRLTNVRYIVSAAPLDREPALRGRVRRVTPRLFRLSNPLPRAWMVASLHPPPTGALADLAREGFDPTREALAAVRRAGPPLNPGQFKVEEIRYDRPNRIEIVAKTPTPATLFLSESAYPGWRVWVDGHERPVLKLNLLFQGVALPPGRHRVVFAFRPRHFPVFAGISVFALALLAFAWISTARRAKRYRDEKPQTE